MTWSRQFEEPIDLPEQTLSTLELVRSHRRA
jgi:hypothetical protein